MVKAPKKRLLSTVRISFVLLLLLFATQRGMAQDVIKVRGIVKDTVGGLPGVNIAVEGTKLGTSTDGDGNFKIDVPKKGTLTISFVGFIAQKFDIQNFKPTATESTS